MIARRVLLAALILVVSATAAWAQGKPVVRISFSPSGTVVVGQQVTLTVQVLVPNYFLSAPDWPTLDVEGAIVTMPDDVLPHLSETIGGVEYAGVQRHYVIAAQQEGEIALPPVSIPFQYAAVPGQPPANGVVALPAARFTARWPAGAHTDGGVLPVARLSVSEAFDRRERTFKVGDTLTETITTTAPGTQPMMIVPPEITAPNGMRLYRKDPVLTSETGTHSELLAGRRVDRLTYRFDKPGHFTIPAVEFPWFDTKANRREVARAAAVVIDVAEGTTDAIAIPPAAPPAAPPPPPPSLWQIWRGRLPWIGGAIVLLLALVWIGRRLFPRYRQWSRERQVTRAASEATAFSQFEQACASDDPRRAYAALARWAWRAGGVSIGEWRGRLGDSALTALIVALEQRLFATDATAASPWSGAALRHTAGRARQAWLAHERHVAAHPSHLPALNP